MRANNIHCARNREPATYGLDRQTFAIRLYRPPHVQLKGSCNNLGLGAHPTANGTFDPSESSKGGKSAIVRCGQWANVKMRFAPTPDENPAADCAH